MFPFQRTNGIKDARAVQTRNWHWNSSSKQQAASYITARQINTQSGRSHVPGRGLFGTYYHARRMTTYEGWRACTSAHKQWKPCGACTVVRNLW
jgi:hypothetical protein